jgi:ABC-2 type transport system permease protein
MSAIFAYLNLNIKMLLKDKLPFLWSISLPIVMLLLNKNSVNEAIELRYWWSYIIISSYVFGVGLHALRLREEGLLKTFFSIKQTKMEFFFANLITQILYSLVCLTIFDIFACFMFGFNFFYCMWLSVLSIIYALPIAFLSYNLTLFSKLHYNLLNTVVMIVIFALFCLMQYNHTLNDYNILLTVSNSLIFSAKDLIIYFSASLACIFASFYSILKYSVASTEVR